LPRSGRPQARGRSSQGDLARLGPSGTSALERARSGAPHLVPATLALLAALAGYLGFGRLLACGRTLESGEAQVRQALARQDRARLDDVYGFHAGGTVELSGLRFEDVGSAVTGGRAEVVAMLTARGRAAWRDEVADLAYIGREKFHMRPCAIALWCGEGDEFDRLRGVLTALFRHRDALAQRDPQAMARLLAPDYHDRGEDGPAVLRRLFGEGSGPFPHSRVRAWQIRVERTSAEVGEDLEVERPGEAPRRERHLYRLLGEGGRWLFAGGV